MQIFYKGKMYKRLDKNEVIEEGALHNSKDNPVFKPIMGVDTVGDVPSSFDSDRIFYNPVKK